MILIEVVAASGSIAGVLADMAKSVPLLKYSGYEFNDDVSDDLGWIEFRGEFSGTIEGILEADDRVKYYEYKGRVREFSSNEEDAA